MSTRVLLIKLTSMGDLMHALPAVTDAANAIPGIRFDWVVDEAFAEVASWHPAVETIICSAHRRWKKNLSDSIFGGQLKHFYQQLNAEDYDIIFDAQNNIKSAFITWLRRGDSHGLDKNSIREKPAHWAYKHHYHTDKNQHAIARQRQLFSQVLNYPLPTSEPDYGIDRSRMQLPSIDLPDNYLFFVHNASWTTKLWPEGHWHQLIEKAADNNYSVLLPCGNEQEHQRAIRLAKEHSNAIALPRLSLSEVGALLNHAQGAVCCDTGLCHLAALLDTPSVSFYGPTDVKLIGASGHNQHHLIASTSTFNCAPCYARQCNFSGENTDLSACMNSFSVDSVWDNLTTLITHKML